MRSIDQLHQFGQSIWYDNIQRSMLENGGMAKLIASGDIRGVTSNPAIFHNAIAKSHDYDAALIPLARAGLNAEQIFNELAIEDIRNGADLFQGLYAESAGGDGYVSLEVSPTLARDTQGTIAEAKRLWAAVQRPNLCIKIPATLEGIPAIREVIAEGINVNVTLIFSLERYLLVMDAFLSGLEKRSGAGLPIGSIASVASFFVSRVDAKVDPLLQALAQSGGSHSALTASLAGKAAIANAKLAYKAFLDVFSNPRYTKLAALGGRLQRPLWASTSTKNPSYRDVIYVEELIGPNTVNTMPPATLDAFRDHGIARDSLAENLEAARTDMASLQEVGISMAQITSDLEQEGVKAFADAFTALMKTLEERRLAALA